MQRPVDSSDRGHVRFARAAAASLVVPVTDNLEVLGAVIL